MKIRGGYGPNSEFIEGLDNEIAGALAIWVLSGLALMMCAIGPLVDEKNEYLCDFYRILYIYIYIY